MLVNHYVSLLIPVCVLRGKSSKCIKHPVIVSLNFICHSVENHLTEYIYGQDIPVFFNTIAGQCLTNPWPAVPDCKCRCQTFIRHLHVNFRHQTALSPASSMDVLGVFLSTTSSIDVQCVPPEVWTRRVYSFLPPTVWTCMVYVCINARLCGIRSVRQKYSMLEIAATVCSLLLLQFFFLPTGNDIYYISHDCESK